MVYHATCHFLPFIFREDEEAMVSVVFLQLVDGVALAASEVAIHRGDGIRIGKLVVRFVLQPGLQGVVG